MSFICDKYYQMIADCVYNLRYIHANTPEKIEYIRQKRVKELESAVKLAIKNGCDKKEIQSIISIGQY